MNKIRFGIAAAAIGVMMPVQMALADGGSAPPASLSELTAQWWQWALSIPTGQNPQLDPTGQYCMVGQRGPIWFLAGVQGGGPATRTCSVPEGAALFFPVINDVSINSPNVCGSGPENESVKDLRQMSKSFIDGVPPSSVKVQVDGNKTPFRRVQSQVFEVALPDDNVFDAFCGGPGSVPATIYSPSVDDGYYVTLGPLKPGEHTIHFQAEPPPATPPTPPTDVTYTITVVPVSLR
jgi:hypothetical protein